MNTILKISGLFFFLLIIVVILEISAHIIFPNFADDKKFLNLAYNRLLNSQVLIDPTSDNYSKKFGFQLSPNSEKIFTTEEFRYKSKTNSLGFRTKEIEEKRDDEYRLLLVGDSMFWGVGVEEEDTISAIMEKSGKTKLSVYNYSVSGYNTVQELIVAKEYIERVEPDQVILGFFIANDIIPNAVTYIDEDGNYRNSAEISEEIKEQLKDRFGIFYNSVIFRIVALSVYVPRLRYQIASSSEVIAKSYILIDQFDKLAKKNSIKFSIVIFYPRDSIQGGIVEKWSNSINTGKLIASFCHQNSIEVLDILDYMNTADDKKKYFFKHDGHPNREGNAVIGEAIFRDLVEPHIKLYTGN
ncbi:MAG: SGNH/GDSL hydrolase family protein [Campylobacterota bacterium]|nr:SGNH/GDSL hydrolase family protein [Campylobacterota bacterium]